MQDASCLEVTGCLPPLNGGFSKPIETLIPRFTKTAALRRMDHIRFHWGTLLEAPPASKINRSMRSLPNYGFWFGSPRGDATGQRIGELLDSAEDSKPKDPSTQSLGSWVWVDSNCKYRFWVSKPVLNTGSPRVNPQP